MSRTCMIVDDADDVRLLMSLTLRSAGYHVVAEAATADDALAAAVSTSPEIVLLDLLMPDVDGTELLQALRAALPDATILVCSVFDAVERREAYIAAGADDHVLKTDIPDVPELLAGRSVGSSGLAGSAALS